MGAMASQITSFMIVYSTVYSGADKKDIKAPRHLPLCGVTGEFPAKMASNAENVSIWWRHHGHGQCIMKFLYFKCYSSPHRIKVVLSTISFDALINIYVIYFQAGWAQRSVFREQSYQICSLDTQLGTHHIVLHEFSTSRVPENWSHFAHISSHML